MILLGQTSMAAWMKLCLEISLCLKKKKFERSKIRIKNKFLKPAAFI